MVCVVEEPRDIVAVERAASSRAATTCCGGAIRPIEGIGPDQLHVRELVLRLGEDDVQEVILCTNPNIEGEATAMYLGRLARRTGIRVTRIASGLPVGGDLEYADEVTLGRASVGTSAARPIRPEQLTSASIGNEKAEGPLPTHRCGRTSGELFWWKRPFGDPTEWRGRETQPELVSW